MTPRGVKVCLRPSRNENPVAPSAVDARSCEGLPSGRWFLLAVVRPC